MLMEFTNNYETGNTKSILKTEPKIYSYEKGLKNFFNIRRNEVKVSEIVHFLPFLDKMQCFNLSKSIFNSVKRDVDFKQIEELLNSLGQKDLEELNLSEIYETLSAFYKQHSTCEASTKLHEENMLIFVAGILNKKYLEPGRYKSPKNTNQELYNPKFYRKFDLLIKEDWNFYNNKLDKQGLKIVSNCLYFNKNLKSLLIRNCAIDDEALQNLLIPLSKGKNETLETLDLMYNLITDEGCKKIRDFLFQNSNLKILDIGNNPAITITGLGYIFEGLADNYTLKSLSLQGLNLEDSSFNLFKKVFSSNRHLNKIEIHNNKLTHVFLNNLKDSLISGYASINEINLRGNKLGDEGANIISEIIKNSSVLVHYDLKATGISEIGGQVILKAYRENQKIKNIKIQSNFVTNNTLNEDYKKENDKRKFAKVFNQ